MSDHGICIDGSDLLAFVAAPIYAHLLSVSPPGSPEDMDALRGRIARAALWHAQAVISESFQFDGRRPEGKEAEQEQGTAQ